MQDISLDHNTTMNSALCQAASEVLTTARHVPPSHTHTQMPENTMIPFNGGVMNSVIRLANGRCIPLENLEGVSRLIPKPHARQCSWWTRQRNREN